MKARGEREKEREKERERKREGDKRVKGRILSKEENM